MNNELFKICISSNENKKIKLVDIVQKNNLSKDKEEGYNLVASNENENTMNNYLINNTYDNKGENNYGLFKIIDYKKNRKDSLFSDVYIGNNNNFNNEINYVFNNNDE